MGTPEITRPANARDFDAVRALFREYVSAPDWEPGFAAYLAQQDFEHELAAIEAAYAPPLAGLLLARVDAIPAGCVAFKPLKPPVICEMKRLWVRPEYRGAGVARRLIGALRTAARDAGYARMRLDTLPSMQAAQRLYRALGFREIAPYCANPVPGAIFMEGELTDGEPAALPSHHTGS